MTSIRRTLLTAILGGLLVVLAASGLASYLVARSGFRVQFDQSLLSRARTFATLVVEEAVEPEDPDDEGGLVLDYKGSLAEADLGLLLRITDEDGEPIAQSPDWPASLIEPLADVEEDHEPVFASVQLEDGRLARAAALVTFARKEPLGPDEPPVLELSELPVVVEVIARLDPVARSESAVLTALLVGALLAALGTSIAVALGIKRGLTPLDRLRSELDDIDPRATDRGSARSVSSATRSAPYPSELAPITTALDNMLARVRAAMERERRFTDAAAHELRTPLAELRTVTDVADRWPEPERLQRAVTEARAIADEMESLLASLLAVARGLANEKGDVAPIPLLPLAREIAAAPRDALAQRRITLSFEGDDHAAWTAPRGATLAIIRNLVENAVEYTADGGSIRIRVTSARDPKNPATAAPSRSSPAAGGGGGRGFARSEGVGDQPHAPASAHGAIADRVTSTAFTIENGPVSLDPAHLDRLFEPFWRADESRADRRHRGLGLAIVASVADALHLRRAASLDAGRLRITISS